MEAIHWLILDNAFHYWPLSSNLSKENYDLALRWSEEQGFIRDGMITLEGQGYFYLHRHESCKKSRS
jgi:hypothetical protein